MSDDQIKIATAPSENAPADADYKNPKRAARKADKDSDKLATALKKANEVTHGWQATLPEGLKDTVEKDYSGKGESDLKLTYDDKTLWVPVTHANLKALSKAFTKASEFSTEAEAKSALEAYLLTHIHGLRAIAAEHQEISSGLGAAAKPGKSR